MTVWYRYCDDGVTPIDGSDLPHRQYPVLRETPCGVWLRVGLRDRWVSKTARKRFAYPTRELARKSYLARKVWHVTRLRDELERAEERLMKTRAFLNRPPAPEPIIMTRYGKP